MLYTLWFFFGRGQNLFGFNEEKWNFTAAAECRGGGDLNVQGHPEGLMIISLIEDKEIGDKKLLFER